MIYLDYAANTPAQKGRWRRASGLLRHRKMCWSVFAELKTNILEILTLFIRQEYVRRNGWRKPHR